MKFDIAEMLNAEIPSFQQMLDDPLNCPLPKNSTGQRAQVFTLVTKVKDRAMAEAVSVYVTRMEPEAQASFVYHAVCHRYEPQLLQFGFSKTFGKLLMEHYPRVKRGTTKE